MPSGIDAELIASLPADLIASFDLLFAYGSNLGASGGPALATDPVWIRAQTKPTWLIYFPGANLASALAEARSYACVVGVVMDLEPGVERDPWSLRQCQAFGSFMQANGMPAVIYSHQETCASLAADFAGQWWDGQPEPASLSPKVAVQYGQQVASNGVAYDLSLCDVWFLQGRSRTMSYILHYVDSDGSQFIMPEGTHIDGAQSAAMVAAGIVMVNLPQAECAGILANSNAAVLAAIQAIPLANSNAAVLAAIHALPAPATPAQVAAARPVKLTFAGVYKGGSTSGTATGTLS